MRDRVAVCLPLLLACTLLLTGCGVPASERGVGSYTAPGLRDLPGKDSRAIGTLVHEDLEGGFWAIKDALPEQVTSDTPNVVVVANPQDLEEDLPSLEGQYVAAVGEMLQGASIRQAGPEMRVISIEPAPENSP